MTIDIRSRDAATQGESFVENWTSLASLVNGPRMTRLPVSLPLLAALLAALLGCALLGCGAPATDARFATPEATVATLLRAYDLEDVSQDEVRARLAAHSRIHLRDHESYEACFADLSTHPADQGLAGYVVGALAAGKDELRYHREGDRATVSPAEGVEIVMRRGEDGAYRVVLARSVPREVRARMASLAEHAEGRVARGLPTD